MHNLDTLSWACRIQGRSQCALDGAKSLEHLALPLAARAELLGKTSGESDISEDKCPSQFNIKSIQDFSVCHQSLPHLVTSCNLKNVSTVKSPKPNIGTLRTKRCQSSTGGQRLLRDRLPPWALCRRAAAVSGGLRTLRGALGEGKAQGVRVGCLSGRWPNGPNWCWKT